MEIQWYPGHMAKAKRILSEQLRKVDLVVELCDARLPLSSRNPALSEMIGEKRHLLLLCKADLAEEAKTKGWVRFFKAQGIETMAYDKTPAKTKQAKQLMDKVSKDFYERNERRGIQKTLRAMVVGVPNVGKSTFINCLYGGAIAETGDRPGVTRESRWMKITPYLEVLDTPGLLCPKMEDQQTAARLAYIGTIRDAVYDQNELTLCLLSELIRLRPKETIERFKIKHPEVDRALLLDEVCRGRGFLLRGGELDYDRGCAVVLDEFREGKLGRLTLESEDITQNEAIGETP